MARLVNRSLLGIFVFSLFSLPIVPLSFAAELTGDFIQLGGFYGPYLPTDFTLPATPPPIALPDNDATFQNYFMGRTSTASFTTSERRVFFIYDLSTLTIPALEEVVSVTIDLELLPGGTSALANFTGFEEVVEFSGSFYSDAEILDPVTEGVDPVDVWASFGMGPFYGGFPLLAVGHPSGDPPTVPDTYSIDLPGSIPDVTSAIGSSLFIVTARLVTYDPGPIETLGFGSAVDPYEYVFGLTDVVTPSGSAIPAPKLIITTATVVPEPTSMVLFVGLSTMALCRRRRA